MTTTDQYCAQLKEYRRILDMTRNSENAIQLLDARREANAAILNGTITATHEAMLCVARSAMRKAFRCKTFSGLHGLSNGYTEIHKNDPLFQGEAHWFFMVLFQPTRVRMMKAAGFMELRFGPQAIEVDR